MRNSITFFMAIVWVAIASFACGQAMIKTLNEDRKDPLLSNRSFLASLEKLDGLVRITDKPFLCGSSFNACFVTQIGPSQVAGWSVCIVTICT